MLFIKIFFIVLLVEVLAWFVIILMDRFVDKPWYKRHPGANERFAQIDDELTSQGQ